MDSLRRLEEIFVHFPGIGPRQARRFVYYLMNKPPTFIKEFIQLIEEVKKSSSECDRCHRIFIGNHTKKALCNICSDENRDQSVLTVVSRDFDFESIEKSGAYKGLYFILGGTVPILDKDPEKRIRLKALLSKIESDHNFKEIILSLNTTPDGEHTANIIKEIILKITKDKGIKISTLGRGLSTGAELEYADGETIKNALNNRA
jgi:recombination protein RecR